MIVKLSILILLISGSAYSQTGDTTFLFRDIRVTPSPTYHVVFIDSSDKFRKPLLDFSFNQFDSLTFVDGLASLGHLNKNWFDTCNGFPRKWIATYLHQGNYYLYYPSNFGNHYAFEITDSLIISYEMEGPLPGKANLLRCSFPNEVAFEMKIGDNSNKVNIKIIDAVTGIAECEFLGEDKVQLKRLMVDANKAGKLLTIVNYCKTDRMEEFNFESVE